MSTELRFSCKHFRDLTTKELYTIHQLRQAVFVLEQNCFFIEMDGLDLECWHLMGYNKEEELVAYSRLLPEGLCYTGYVSIGRVCTALAIRKFGYGKHLMKESIQQTDLLFGSKPIKIGAQSYLLRFYEEFGFSSTGEEYLEDGILHTQMILAKQNS